MEIYIDSGNHCHTTNPDGTYRAFEVPFFNSKCTAFVEGYIYVPLNETYTRPSDGKVFEGKMITPFKDYNILAAAQQQYETMLVEMDAAYQEGVISA